jgi:hypothetical protein
MSNVLQDIHALLAANFKHALEQDAKWAENPDSMPLHIPLTAADKAAIAKFLKDNNVVSEPVDNAALEKLRQQSIADSKARRERLKDSLSTAKNNILEMYGLGGNLQ